MRTTWKVMLVAIQALGCFLQSAPAGVHEERVTVGVFGVGLDTYWAQFPGLQQRLEGYLGTIVGKMSGPGVEVVSAGLVDTQQKAREAGEIFRSRGVTVVFLYISTYALSSTVLPVAQAARVPFVVLNLQPTKAIDYAKFNALGDRGKMTGEWLAYCQACAVPEVASVFSQAEIPFHLVTGTLDDQEVWKEIGEWVDAAHVKNTMASARMGIMGHYYNGMLDVYTNPTPLSIGFGCHIQHVEIDELRRLRTLVTADELSGKLREIEKEFTILPECPRSELERAGRTACALDRLIKEQQLDGLSYYYEGVPGSEEEDVVTSIIVGNSLLTGRHIPVAGENEVKNVHAMKILDAFGAGGSFSEFYAMDFEKDEILLGHDGPGHIAIADGKPVLKPLGVFHGKPGKGLSVEMRIKHGPVTLLAVAQTSRGKLKLVVAEGESVPGPILEIGNTNSRYKFHKSVREFIGAWSQEGPAHHCAIGIGHVASRIEKLAALLGMEFVQIR
jgi:L-arabinose isomerase